MGEYTDKAQQASDESMRQATAVFKMAENDEIKNDEIIVTLLNNLNVMMSLHLKQTAAFIDAYTEAAKRNL